MRISDWSSDVCSSDLPSSHKMLVVARTKKLDQVARRTEGISMFIIDTARQGVSHNEIEKLGTNRSEERRVGKECVRTRSSRGSTYHYKKNRNNNHTTLKISPIHTTSYNIKSNY